MKSLIKYTIYLVLIILAFIIFWPVGCILLYLKWRMELGKYKAFSRALFITGIGIFLFGLLSVAVFIDSKEIENVIISIIIFVTPGMLLMLWSRNRNKKIEKYNKYLNYINVRRKVEIDEMCNMLEVNLDDAISDLTKMINIGLINGYLTNNELILNNVIDINTNKESSQEKEQKEIKIVKCTSCGAETKLENGEKKECEYCGTILG